MRVRDVLKSKGVSEVYTISPDATVGELLNGLAEYNVGALVVLRSPDAPISGIVSERDIVRKLRTVADPHNAIVSTIMSPEVQTCTMDTLVDELTATMSELHIRHVPVVEEDGRLVGLVSIGDAVKYRMDQLQFERDQLEKYVQR